MGTYQSPEADMPPDKAEAKSSRFTGLLGFLKDNLTPYSEFLKEDPVHLNVFANISCPLSCKMCYGHSEEIRTNYFNSFPLLERPQDMDIETFKLILDRMPEVQTLTFSGWGEPLNNEDIFEMVEYAWELQEAESTLVTNGLLLESRLEPLLNGHLKRLVVSINGHTAEAYTAMTGMDSENFHTVCRNLELLKNDHRRKRHGREQAGESQEASGRKAGLEVCLSFIVDTENYRDIPAMARFAESMGADHVLFENYLSPEPTKRSERTLMKENSAYQSFAGNFSTAGYNLKITLPTLLETDMSEHRNCRDAYTSIGVDGNGNVSACSKQLLYQGKMGKIWDENVWNNDHYQWLRGVHGRKKKNEVPRPCQNCPNNIAP